MRVSLGFFSPKVKLKEGRNAQGLARFCFFNLTAKIMIVLMVYASCLDYLEGLIGTGDEGEDYFKKNIFVSNPF